VADGCIDYGETYSEQTTSGDKLVWWYMEEMKGKEGAEGEYEKVRQDLRHNWMGEREDIYGLTHIILTKSGYYQRYLKAEEYPWEVEKLKEVAGKMARREKLSNHELDLASEVVIGLKLLRVPENPDVAKLIEAIKSRQQPNGSWGEPGVSMNNRIHHTVVGILALAPFPDELGQGNVYCW